MGLEFSLNFKKIVHYFLKWFFVSSAFWGWGGNLQLQEISDHSVEVVIVLLVQSFFSCCLSF